MSRADRDAEARARPRGPGPASESDRADVRRKFVKWALKQLRKVSMATLTVGVAVGGVGTVALGQNSFAVGSDAVAERLSSAFEHQYQGCLAKVRESQEQRAGDLETGQRDAVGELENRHARQLGRLDQDNEESKGARRDAQGEYEDAIGELRRDWATDLERLRERSRAEAATAPDQCGAGLTDLPRAYRQRVEQDNPNVDDTIRETDKQFQERVDKLEGEYVGRVRGLHAQFMEHLPDPAEQEDDESESESESGQDKPSSSSTTDRSPVDQSADGNDDAPAGQHPGSEVSKADGFDGIGLPEHAQEKLRDLTSDVEQSLPDPRVGLPPR